MIVHLKAQTAASVVFVVILPVSWPPGHAKGSFCREQLDVRVLSERCGAVLF